jgi:hypothetical protein
MFRRLRNRLHRNGDDRGSLMLAMLIIVIGSGMSAVMVPMMLTQYNGTRSDARYVRELDAAESGIDSALGHIRAANDNAGNGVLSLLPCGPITGVVSSAATERYSVTITYYKSDPSGQTAAWLASTANQIRCITGGGTYSAPAYALLVSQGTNTLTGTFGSSPTRTVQATYIFKTNNVNIPGGAIHVYKTSTSTDLCFDAGSTSPAAGTNLQMQPCVSGSSQQKFEYDTNLNIVLVTSKTPTQPLGMCLDAGTPQASNAIVTFQPCSTTTIPQQQWSENDNANLSGTTDGKTLDSFCFNVQSPNVAGSFVILSTNCGGAYDNIQTFQPEAAVGAGAAGASSGQLVNYSQFGRCLDITNQNVNSTYLIAWPCKQAPDPTNVSWNQRYSLPAPAPGSVIGTGEITTNPSSGLYCLQSPLAVGSGQYVTVVPCPKTALSSQIWSVSGNTQLYATSYEITDSAGYCLQPTDPTATPPDFANEGNNISKIIVAVCNGSTLQKWNAPPDTGQPTPLKNYNEK